MLGRKLVTSLNTRSAGSRGLRITSLFSTTSYKLNLETDDAGAVRRPRKLKEWRTMPKIEPSFWSMLKTTPNENEKPKPRRILALELRKWFKATKENYVKLNQCFIEERHQTLGCDLAAAHFLVFRGGKVKFYDQSEWKVANEDGTYDLPEKFDPSWRLTHMDASNVNLYYEGFENFQNLRVVCWASFKGNEYLDDWCMDKVSAHFPNVEYLDVSECPLLTERGLEAVYKLCNLKKLIVTDWHKQPSFELTCALLEDCCSDLTIEILEPPENNKEDKNK